AGLLGRGIGDGKVQLDVRPAGVADWHTIARDIASAAVCGGRIGARGGGIVSLALVPGEDLAVPPALAWALAGRFDIGRVEILGWRDANDRTLMKLGDLGHLVLISLPQGAVIAARVVVHPGNIPEILATLHPVQYRLEPALATCQQARAGACCVGIGVGGTRGGSQGGIILQPGDLTLDVADGLASGMPDWHPALTGQLLAVVRRGLFSRAGRPRPVVGLDVAAGFDRVSASTTDARHRI